jgi:hypothetical protein
MTLAKAPKTVQAQGIIRFVSAKSQDTIRSKHDDEQEGLCPDDL